MLKIKLARFGKKHQPHFRIVVNEARDKRDGQYTALLGHYAPVTKELKIDTKAYEEWLKKGAQPTDTVASLFERFKSGNPFPERKAKSSKKALAKAAAAKAEVEAPKEEAPVEEKPAEEEAEVKEEAPVETEEAKTEEIKEEVAAEEKPEAPAEA